MSCMQRYWRPPPRITTLWAPLAPTPRRHLPENGEGAYQDIVSLNCRIRGPDQQSAIT